MLSRIPTAEQEASATRGGQPAWNAWTPTGLYNGMIAPIVPYGIAGAIWYQGESNAGRAYQYRTLFPAMIRSWREAWNQGDFPFVWVQLANFTKRLPEPAESDWAELREAQTMTLALPKTGQAVIIDIGEADDIHPRNKQDVGQRLAIQAQAIAYGDADLPSSGPTYKSMVVKAGKAIVTFANTAGGLESRDQMPIGGFAVAGTDRKFVWAEARISGSTVLVSSPSVPEPVAVRYGWANNPNCNLYNSAGLPAGPFRTDDWPGVTVDKR
jgi:sialate O-acetylesterase